MKQSSQPKNEGLVYYPDGHNQIAVDDAKVTYAILFHMAELRYLERSYLQEIQQHLIQQHTLHVDIGIVSN